MIDRFSGELAAVVRDLRAALVADVVEAMRRQSATSAAHLASLVGPAAPRARPTHSAASDSAARTGGGGRCKVPRRPPPPPLACRERAA